MGMAPLRAQLSITAQPTSQTALPGSTVTFGVKASGAGPLSYQWRFNGTNLPNNIITTVAGGNIGDGSAATNASLYSPLCVAVDTVGNLFITEKIGSRIRKVDTNGIITTVAGGGIEGYSSNGSTATNARLGFPIDVAMDIAGNMFIADFDTHRINKVSAKGIISTVAGNGSYGFTGDGGIATNASLCSPSSVAVDAAGNLYIADCWNHRIRKVSTKGIITTVAGNDHYGYSGDGGMATNASLSFPCRVTVNSSGNLFIAEGNRIRKVNTNGIISTVAGNGSKDYSGDGDLATAAGLHSPTAVAVDAAGNLFIADRDINRIRKVGIDGVINTVAGNSNFCYSGDGGKATNASLTQPSGVAVDAIGNLFIADTLNNRIRKVETNGIITTVAGGCVGDGGAATNASLYSPLSVVVDNAGDLFIADVHNRRIRKVDSTGIITTVAGNGSLGYSGDGGAATNASFFEPCSIATDTAGNLFVADSLCNRIRRLDTNGIITTVAGGGTKYYFDGDGIATNAKLHHTCGVTVDTAGNLFIIDRIHIRRVNTNGIMTTIAGRSQGFLGDGGAATNAFFYDPYGVAVDACNNLFIADTGNSRIRKVDTNGIITTVAGNFHYGYSGDGGMATNACLSQPSSITVDPVGNLFFADAMNNRIRKVDINGVITTVAGNGIGDYSGNGNAATNASLNDPSGVAFDTVGNLYIADMNNNRIRKVLLYAEYPTLTLNNVTTNNMGNYSVIITNPSGSVTSSVVALTTQK